MPLFSRGNGNGNGIGNGAGTPDRPDKSERTDRTEDPPTPSSSSSKSFSARLLRRRPSTKAVPPPIDPGDTDASASASASEPPTASSDGFSLGPPVPTLYGESEGREEGGWRGPAVGVGMGQFGSVSPRLKRPPRPPYTTGSSGSGDGTTQRTVVIDAGGPAPTWSTTPLSFGAGSSSASVGAGGGTTGGSWHDTRDQHRNRDGGQDPQWARARSSVDEARGGLGGGGIGRIADPSTFPTRPLTLDDPLPPLPVGAQQGPTYPTPLSPPRRNTAPRTRPPIPFDPPPQYPAPGPSTTVTDPDPADPNAEGEADVVGSKAWLARKPSTGKLRRPRPDPPVAGVSSPVLRRTNPQRAPMASKPPTTPDRSTDHPSRSQGTGTLQPSPVLLTASSSSGGRRASPSKRRGEDGSNLGGSASVESSDFEGEGEIGLGASAGAAPGEGPGRRTPSPTLMPRQHPVVSQTQRGGGYEVQVSCVAAPPQPALELEPSATARESEGSGEITWTVTIRPRPRADAAGGAGAGGREAVAPSSPLHISASLPGPTGITSDSTTGDSGTASGAGAGSTIASAPLSASSVNLSLSLSQPVGKMVFISFPLDMTPRRAARRPSRSSRHAATGTAGSPPPSVDLAETPSRLDRVDRGKAPPSTTREKRSGWILGSPSPSPSGDLGGEEEDDDLPLTPPRIRTPGAPTPSTPPRMTTPPPNPITPRRVLKYGPQNGQGPAGSPARTPRRSREGPLVYPNGGGPIGHPGSRDASLSRAVGRRSLDGRPGFGAAYGSSGGSGGSSGSAGTEDLGGSLGGGGSARRSRIISASDLDGGLYAPGTVDGLSEELERAL